MTSRGLIHALLRRLAAALGREDGFTMIAMMGAMAVTGLLTVAAFASVDNDQPISAANTGSKQAYAAAEAGVNDYMFHLNQDQSYWTKCTNVPQPNAVNQRWDGMNPAADPRTWRSVPGSTAQYTIELLPAKNASGPTYSQCDPNNAQASMIDSSSGTFHIKVTGSPDATHKVKRQIMVTFRRKGFLDYLYFTDFETSDPYWYAYYLSGDPNAVTWAQTNCSRWNRKYAGPPPPLYNQFRANTGCTQIQFAPGDVVAGPFHTNDEILVCGSPTFGRTSDDRIEISALKNDPVSGRTNYPGWNGAGTCGADSPNFKGTPTIGAPTLTLPPSNTGLKKEADPAYVFTGKTWITFSGTNMIVKNTTMNLNNVTMPLPSNGVIYVDNGNGCSGGYNVYAPYSDEETCGTAYVQGTYGQDITVGAKKDVVVTGDVLRSGDVMLGLIADNFVRLYHPATHSPATSSSCTNDPGTLQNVEIDAALLSLSHSFTVDNYYCGAGLGTLTVKGTIAQKFRGPVGTSGSPGSGYTKNYVYDDRLRFRSPPHFLDPVQSAWRILRYTEVIDPIS